MKFDLETSIWAPGQQCSRYCLAAVAAGYLLGEPYTCFQLWRSYWEPPWMCPQSPLWQWSTVRCFMFEHIEGRNWTCRHWCELGEGCIGDCGWSWFLVVSLQCTVVWCRQIDDGLRDRISSSCWQSASLVEFSNQGYPSSWWRWIICCSRRGQTSQPCVVQTPAGLYGLPGMDPR